MDERLKLGFIEGWGEMWGLAGLSGRSDVKVDGRLRTSLGKCSPEKGSIRINPVLLLPGNEALYEEILCHEAAHLAARLIWGRKVKPHGPEWKGLMRKAGYAPRARIAAGEIKGLVPPARRKGYVYVHACRDCRAVYRALRTDRRWRCPKCVTSGRSGRLKVLEKISR